MKEKEIEEKQWKVQKLCTDVNSYEVIVEQEKRNAHCEQKRESWRWIISYHGSIVASGSCNSSEEAMVIGLKTVPMDAK